MGVRELRQNLSKYLERVKRGERLEVTERGRPVATLEPIPPTTGVLERLIASGRVQPPSRDLLAELPPRGPITDALSLALDAQREDRL